LCVYLTDIHAYIHAIFMMHAIINGRALRARMHVIESVTNQVGDALETRHGFGIKRGIFMHRYFVIVAS
jgi:hypothetical protein